MNKSEILQASADLQAAFDKIQQAADLYPSLLCYFGNGDDKFAECFSSCVDAFGPRLDFFRKRVSRYADVVLTETKKEKRAKAHEAEKTKKKRGRPAKA